MRFLPRIPKPFAKLLFRSLQWGYLKLPLSDYRKKRLKSTLLHHFGFLIHLTPHSPGKHTLNMLRDLDLQGEVDFARKPIFEFFETPMVSVIIPIHNKLDFTFRCLQSIHAHPTQHTFEVIVVDDSSTDDSSAVLSGITNLTLLHNDRNLGFVHSCNKGAEHARGTYLLFLNNDTYVLPGCIDELINTFEEIPDAGLVGSKLIYPNGLLQEAGAIIWQNGLGWNYGRLDDPDKPEYGYLREVDYCSGASIMVPHDLFKAVGCFDIRYAPAYYEDADLAFTMREHGRKVLYQPLSQVIHFEGVSSGRDITQGMKAHQAGNRYKFLAKWEHTLASHAHYGENLYFEKERMVSRRILIIDICTPTPDKDAGSVTAFYFMKAFQSLGYKVTFIPAGNFLHIERYTPQLQKMGIECLYAPYVTNVEQHLKQCGAAYDVILLYRAHNAWLHIHKVRKFCPNAHVIFDTVDLHYLREQRQAALENSKQIAQQAEQTKAIELGSMRLADATIVLSDVEKGVLLNEIPDLTIFTVPLLLDIPGCHSLFSARQDILFIGGYEHPPNVDAVIYFAEKIWPRLKLQLPGIKFHVLGSKPPPEIMNLASEDIIIAGYVEKLDHYFDNCRLSVAPLRYGAGIKGKIGTSLSYGVPCVATFVAAEGMCLENGVNILLADDPDAFAEATIRLYQDETLWNQLSSGGLEFVSRHYSLEAGKERLHNILEHLNTIHPPSRIRTASRRSAKDTAIPPLRMETVTSGTEYDEHHNRMADEYARRKAFEYSLIKKGKLSFKTAAQLLSHPKLLAKGGISRFETTAFCYVCGKKSQFLVDFQYGSVEQGGMKIPNWRERLVCLKCGLNNRMRAAIQLFELIGAPSLASRIYVTEQVTPLYKWLHSHYPLTVGSEYLSESVPWGEADTRGVRNESVTRLTFPDNNLDYILSFDVFEHVPDYAKAFQECLRCLKPGGMLLFTVPFRPDSRTHLVRARLTGNGEVEHLLPAEYHGDPLSSQGCLCFRYFGWELLDELRAIGFIRVTAYLYWSNQLGYLGGEQIAFTGFKA